MCLFFYPGHIVFIILLKLLQRLKDAVRTLFFTGHLIFHNSFNICNFIENQSTKGVDFIDYY